MTPAIYASDGKVFDRDLGRLYAPEQVRRDILTNAMQRRERARIEPFTKPSARRMNARAVETARLLRRAIKEASR